MPFSGASLNLFIHPSEILAIGLRDTPDSVCLTELEKTWTWNDLNQQSDSLAANLLALGLQPGDRVASLMPNRGELIVYYLACFKAGLVATPLNYRYQAPEIDHALQVTQASLLLYHFERTETVSASQYGTSLPCGFLTYASPHDAREKRDRCLETFLEQADRISLPSPALESPALIYFTSGSTGKPKGVTHTYATLGSMIGSFAETLELSPADILLPGSSLSHCGSSIKSFAGLGAGARVDIARQFTAGEIFPLLEKTRPTHLMMLPAALICLVRDHQATREHFSSIKKCLSGGDKVSATLELEFEKLTGKTIDECYGMSELGFVTFQPSKAAPHDGTIGKLAHGFQGSIRQDEGQEVPTGDVGRLWVKSNANMIGYWNRPDATAETIQHDWLDTGDLMSVDDQGYLRFHGRKKQIIIHDGSNICPQEVEASLIEHPAVENAGVIGIHNTVHGENVRAYISLQAGAEEPSTAELIQFSRARVGYKAPEEIVILASLPLNATGKIDRRRLKEMAEAEPHKLGSR